MGDTSLQVLKDNLDAFAKSLQWLERSYEQCRLIGVKSTYKPEEFDAFENLTSRYARTVDLMLGKVLRSIDVVELLAPGSLIDTVNRAEKRGLVDSVSRIRDLKDLRNEIAHEYESADLERLFGAILAAVPEVFATGKRITEYCRKYQQ